MANWPRYLARLCPGPSPVRGGAPRATRPASSFGFFGREVELRMTLRRASRRTDWSSTRAPRAGCPMRITSDTSLRPNGGLLYRLVVEYEPRAGLRGLYDRLLLRRGVERALRQAVMSIADELPRQAEPDRTSVAPDARRSRRVQERGQPRAAHAVDVGLNQYAIASRLKTRPLGTRAVSVASPRQTGAGSRLPALGRTTAAGPVDQRPRMCLEHPCENLLITRRRLDVRNGWSRRDQAGP